MPEKLDPRLMSIWEDEQKLKQKRRPKRPLSREKIQQANESQHKIVAAKRKEQREESRRDSTVKPQPVPQEAIEDSFEEYVALQRAFDAVKPSISSDVKAKTNTSTTFSADPPGTNKGLPSLYECGKQLKLQTRLICYGGSLYVFNGKCYDYLSPGDVVQLYRDKVDYQLGGEKSLRSIKQLHEYLLTDSSLQISEVEGNQRIAVLRNGIFDVETGKLRKHSDKTVVFSCVNANYVDYAECKCFRRFLQCVSHGDEVLQERLWQALGYLLLQTHEAKSFFVMGSAPDSGKSVFGNFIERLFDERYVSNIALNDFNRNFALAPIVGSAINISLDLPATKLKPPAVSMLKMLTGGDTFTISQKYMPEFSYRNRAKLLFASNFPIGLYENDDAFWNRMVFLPFDYNIPKEQQNSELLDMLQAERDAVVSEALRHVKTLIENNFCFPTTPLIERRMQEWQGRGSPSIESFLQDCCIIDESVKGELTDKLFLAYNQYCEERDIEPKSRPKFMSFLKKEMKLTHDKLRLGCNNPRSAFHAIQMKEEYK